MAASERGICVLYDDAKGRAAVGGVFTRARDGARRLARRQRFACARHCHTLTLSRAGFEFGRGLFVAIRCASNRAGWRQPYACRGLGDTGHAFCHVITNYVFG